MAQLSKNTQLVREEPDPRRDRILALNERLRDIGRAECCLESDASDAEIERREHIAVCEEVSRSIPMDTPNRNAVFRDRLGAAMLDRAPAAIKSVVSQARAAISAAAEAKRAADGQIERAIQAHQRLDDIRVRIEGEKARLAWVRSVRDNFAAKLAETDSDSELERRYGPNPATAGFNTQAMAIEVDAGRLFLRAGIDDGNRCEALIVARIHTLETELREAESNLG